MLRTIVSDADAFPATLANKAGIEIWGGAT